MSSLRWKESKIPLKVDSRLKNISKIPVREAKPKILTSSEAETKRTSSAVPKKKPSVNHLDGRKKSRLEIAGKEAKPINLQMKNKGKENRFQVTGRVSQCKGPKTTAENKWIKNSNAVSQILKTRNKHTSEEAPGKLKPVNDNEKGGSFSSFKKKIPVIIFPDDDPFKCTVKKEQMKNSNHPSQQNIEFVADERMKNHILSNRELTPGILKSCSNIKTSVMERPSLYKKLKLPVVDPYEQALADIAKLDLASEGRRVSEMQKNRLFLSPSLNRNSLYKPARFVVDPYKQALEDIAKLDLASDGRRASEMQKNKLFPSPLQNRNSLYKPVKFVGDPYKEALKSLANFRMQQKVKSTKKKVTFKLSGGDRSSETETKNENNGKNSVYVIQPRLTHESEKIVTLSTPEFEENVLLSADSNPPKTIAADLPLKLERVFVNNYETNEQKAGVFNNETSISASSPLKTVASNRKIVNDLSPFLFQRQNSNKYASQEIQNSIRNNQNPFLISKVRDNLFSNQSERFLDKTNRKIFTPRPLSFYPRTQLPDCISPEILSNRTTDILSCAPIDTPLVLKRLGMLELSPVCKKLEFKDSPKATNEEDSRENNQTFCLQNIMTQQKILDQMAHQECSIFMQEAIFPCEIRNYLQNPIAQILNDGDETHFVPVSLQKFN